MRRSLSVSGWGSDRDFEPTGSNTAIIDDVGEIIQVESGAMEGRPGMASETSSKARAIRHANRKL
jgi:hypothetical protein